MKKIRLYIITFLVLLAAGALLSACTLPVPAPVGEPTITLPPTVLLPTAAFTNTPLPTATFLIVPTATFPPPATVTVQPAAPTATIPPPTSTQKPPNTQPPVVINPSGETFKLRFDAGATGTRLSAGIGRDDAQIYLISAQEDQTLIAEIDSPSDELAFALFTSGGRKLNPLDIDLEQVDPHTGGLLLAWQLLSNQEYQLVVDNDGPSVQYELSVTIPRIVRFPRGSFGTSESGVLDEDDFVVYRLRASQDQRMKLELDDSGGEAVLGVVGMEDGDVLLELDEEADAWEGRLPSNQNYLVIVYGLEDDDIRFTVRMTIR